MIKLKEITWDNVNAVLKLTVSDSQKPYILDNKTFLAQGYVNLKLGYLDTLKAITINNQVIGFTKYVHVPQGVEPFYLKDDATLIDAFMIDVSYQGKGYGKTAFRNVLDSINQDERYQAKNVTLLCHKDNKSGHTFFENFNFNNTNETFKSDHQIYLWFDRKQGFNV